MVRLTRRTLLTTAAGGAAVAVTGAGPAEARPAGTAAAGAGLAGTEAAAAALRPISMAMHIHGPFSEGPASYAAHLYQAQQNGVDVIWWTDHDFRVAAHDFRKAVHFDGASEPEGGLAWNWASTVEGTLTSSTAEFVTSPTAPDDPGHALRLAATGNGMLWYAGTAWNYTYGACIADTTLELDVRPEVASADAVLVLRMDLSYHPPIGGRPAGEYILEYRIGGTSAVQQSSVDLVGRVDVPVNPGTWNRLRFNLVSDVQRLWPDLVAEDNALRNLRLGVRVTGGASGSYVVDRLVFHRSRRAGQQGEDLRVSVLNQYANAFPSVTHYRAYEVSLVRHLNWYGGDQTLPAFTSPPVRDNDPALTASMVKFLHSHGGIVCWNHPMDIEKRESLAKLMVSQNKLGTDLVEIGRAELLDLLWTYDVAARNGLFFTAIGASDDHDALDWFAVEEPYLTYVWAPSTARSELVKALRKGSAWFTDALRYRGSMDLRMSGKTVMGGVLVTKATKVSVQAVATDLPAGATLEVITGVADFAGTGKLTPSTSTKIVKKAPYTFTVKPGKGVYVRTQVRSADRIVGVSNPLWLLPKKPPRAIPSDRKL